MPSRQGLSVEQVDWNELFQLSLPFWELIVRGSVMYWFLFLIYW
jgi:hypothetical protein